MACYLIKYQFAGQNDPTQQELNEFKDFFETEQSQNSNPIISIGNLSYDINTDLVSFNIEIANPPLVTDFMSTLGNEFLNGNATIGDCPEVKTFEVRYYNNPTVPNSPGETPLAIADFSNIENGIQALIDGCANCGLPKLERGLILYAIKQDNERLAYRIVEIGFDFESGKTIYYLTEYSNSNVKATFF